MPLARQRKREPLLPWQESNLVGGPFQANVTHDAEQNMGELPFALCVAKLASPPEIIDFLGRSLQFVDHFTGPNSR